MLFANLRFIKAINKIAKVKSMLNNIGVIKICSHTRTTLHKRLSKYKLRNLCLSLLKTRILFLMTCFINKLMVYLEKTSIWIYTNLLSPVHRWNTCFIQFTRTSKRFWKLLKFSSCKHIFYHSNENNNRIPILDLEIIC